MGVLILVCFCLALSRANTESTNLTDFYVDLINKETERALTSEIIFDADEHSPRTNKITEYGIFRHIIIGAGTSGSVVANALSEDSLRDVLLLEAGSTESNFSSIPAMNSYLLGLEYNWNFYTTAQTTSCLGMIRKQCGYPSGKGLGGSTLINSLIYTRGYKQDYEDWLDQGNQNWGYKDILPYFQKLEFSSKSNKNFRKRSNSFNVEFHEPYNTDTKIVLQANRELGIPILQYNTDNQTGAFRPKFVTSHGQRLTTARAFLQSIRSRKNLRILQNSFVIKILVNKQNKAYGVIFVKNGNTYIARSRQDIVLSAGVFGSPQILMLSGVGPRFHLNLLGIKTIQDLPVGNNLVDHATYPSLAFETNNYTEPYRTLKGNVQQYLNGFGPLTVASNIRALAFLRTKYSKNEPDMELLFTSSYNNNVSDHYPDVFNYDQETFNALSTVGKMRTIKIYPVLIRPKSKGYLRLHSANPFTYPKINPKLLSDPDNQDIETLYEGIQLALKFINTTAFSEINATLKDQTLPTCRKYKYLSKQYWYCQLRQIGSPFFHPVGTCKMGVSPSEGAVVDSKLRVFGIQNLRIADVSVFPTPISTHPMVTAIVIGEKVADLIKNSNNFQGY